MHQVCGRPGAGPLSLGDASWRGRCLFRLLKDAHERDPLGAEGIGSSEAFLPCGTLHPGALPCPIHLHFMI